MYIREQNNYKNVKHATQKIIATERGWVWWCSASFLSS